MDADSCTLLLGMAIREFRTKAGLSQEAFAHEVGVHRTYMGSIERGERNVSLVNLVRISEALGVPLSKLIARAESLE